MKTKTTLGTEFQRLRKSAGETLLSLANRCDIAETTVWKVEHDKQVRWETVHLCLLIGLRIPPGTDRYQAIHALWLKARNTSAEEKPHGKNAKNLSPHAAAAVREFRERIRDLDKAAISKVMRGVRRATA